MDWKMEFPNLYVLLNCSVIVIVSDLGALAGSFELQT